MLKMTALCSLPLLALATIDYTQEQNLAAGQSQWVCGNQVGTAAHLPVAGVVELRSASLEHVRTDAAELAAMSAEDQARTQAKSFSDLFCYDYLRRYQNPIEENGIPGVCIRNIGVGQKWLAILDTDEEVRVQWQLFGTSFGYQKAAPVFNEEEEDASMRWGSGRTGSVPANWCSNYMKDMLCHIAFPQFADVATTITGGATGLGSRVRPVCSDDCENLMDNCNRLQPRPYEGVQVPWLQGKETDDEDIDNVLYCKAWNKGYQLALAGTGVGTGDDDNDEEFCAVFESSAVVYPMVAMTVVSLLAHLF